jgi:hypothetical protein
MTEPTAERQTATTTGTTTTRPTVRVVEMSPLDKFRIQLDAIRASRRF